MFKKKAISETWLNGLFVVLFVVHILYLLFNAKLVLDDAFIYYRVAENFLAGNGSVFNIGDKTFIVTSPLWLYLLIAGKALFPALSLPALAYILYLVFAILACFLLRKLLISWDCLAAALSPIAVLSMTPTGSCVGMETTLVFSLGIAVLLAYSSRRHLLLGLLSSLLYLARPDQLILVALVGTGFIS